MTNAHLKEFAMAIKKISRTTVQKKDEAMSGKKIKEKDRNIGRLGKEEDSN